MIRFILGDIFELKTMRSSIFKDHHYRRNKEVLMKKSPTDFIDFSEIGSDDRFEKFAEHFLEDMGFNIDRPPAFGPDRKRDLFVSEPVRFSKRGFRWLVSCKYYSERIGQGDDEANANKLVEHDCDGFMFIYSHEPTNSLMDSIESVCRRLDKPYKFFTGWDIEKALLSYSDHTKTFRHHFPHSFNTLSQLKDCPQCECKSHTNGEGEPLYLLSLQRNQTDFPEYRTICHECIYDIHESLDEQYYRWTTCVLVKEFW